MERSADLAGTLMQFGAGAAILSPLIERGGLDETLAIGFVASMGWE